MIPLELSTSRRTPAAAAPAHDPAATRKLGALRRLGRAVDAQNPRVAREAAALLTAQLFFAPVLAEMRRFPFGRELGHGGRMEEAFGEQLDQCIADTVARSDAGLTEHMAGYFAPAGRGRQLPATEAAWPAALQARSTIGGSR